MKDLIVWIWLVAGLIFIVAELIIPGLIVVFFGLAALIVSASLYLGFISEWISAFTMWFISSFLLIFILRSLFRRFMQGDMEKQNTYENLDVFGAVVEVIEKIEPEKNGRIRFRGTIWTAKCYDNVLLPGAKAEIVFREDIDWVVEAIDLIDENE